MCRLSRPVRGNARHALPVRFLLQAKRAHNGQQSPTTAASSSFYHLGKPATTLGRRARGEKPELLRQVLPFLMPFYNGESSHSVFATAGITQRRTHTRGRQEQVSMTATQPHCKPEAFFRI